MGLLIAVASAFAQDTSVENQLKAAYVFNLAKFTQWPAWTLDASGEATVCVAGNDPFGAALAGLESRTLQQRTVRLRRNVRAESFDGCWIVVVPRSEATRVGEILGEIADRPILTLSDVDGFVQRGGIIGLSTQGNRVVFDVNIDAANRAKLKLSSQMLKLARNVRGRP